MLRSLYYKNFLLSKSFWHFLNENLLSNTAQQKHLVRWDRFVRNAYILLNGSYHIKNKNGLKYLLDVNNLIDLRIIARGSYEAKQQDFFFNLLTSKQCSIFCDIGANWGMYSLRAARLPSISQVYAFEPEDKNRSQLSANIFLNNFHKKITVYDYAISSFTGKASFSATPPESGQLQNRGTSKLSEDGNVSVQVKKLDDILIIAKQKIAFKIDIEGNELDAIKGMTNTLKLNSCVLQVEVFKDKKEALHRQMTTLNYELVHVIGNDHYYSNC